MTLTFYNYISIPTTAHTYRYMLQMNEGCMELNFGLEVREKNLLRKKKGITEKQ